MKFRSRFDGELQLNANALGIVRPVKQGETFEVRTDTAEQFSESLLAYVASGKLAPVDTEAREFTSQK